MIFNKFELYKTEVINDDCIHYYFSCEHDEELESEFIIRVERNEFSLLDIEGNPLVLSASGHLGRYLHHIVDKALKGSVI